MSLTTAVITEIINRRTWLVSRAASDYEVVGDELAALLLAWSDVLTDENDPRAAGIMWLAEHKRSPFYWSGSCHWYALGEGPLEAAGLPLAPTSNGKKPMARAWYRGHKLRSVAYILAAKELVGRRYKHLFS